MLILPPLNNTDSIEIGQIVTLLGADRTLPISVDVRISDWIVYHTTHPGSMPENELVH